MGHRGRATRLACANGLLTRQKSPGSRETSAAYFSPQRCRPHVLCITAIATESLSVPFILRSLFSGVVVVQSESSDRDMWSYRGEEDEGHTKDPGICEGPPQDGSVHHELPVMLSSSSASLSKLQHRQSRGCN
ncbi:unnamed protein product [Pleuronectes platessa]|uniref:Uncharacterized protein n=1 Tax=Pleuronectes platessa TaxID=8262 RepID=A0A9N7TSW8_PLEPL|nr:unnamed protein product [Pleuronectes platessa]